MNKKIFFSFAMSIALLQIFSVQAWTEEELSLTTDESSEGGRWTGDELSFGFDESSDPRFKVWTFNNPEKSQSEETSNVTRSEPGELAFLLQTLSFCQSQIKNFKIPESMKEIVIQLPTQDYLLHSLVLNSVTGHWEQLCFNFAPNGAEDFCEQIYSKDRNIAQMLALIAQTTQKNYAYFIGLGEMKESSVVVKIAFLEEIILRFIFKNHPEVLDEISAQHKENGSQEKNVTLCDFFKRYQGDTEGSSFDD